MLQVDVLSAYVICGAGSLIGAAMMRLVDTPDPRLRRALDISLVGFLILGVALGSVYFVGPSPGAISQGIMAGGTMAAMVVFSAAMALFAGAAPPHNVILTLLLGASAGVAVLAPLADLRAFLQVASVGMAVAASLVALFARRFIWRPRDVVERALGLAVAALAISGWLRAVLCFTTEAAPPSHLLLLPDWMISPYAVLYGMLPILVATLLLSLVNARLRRHLNLRATTDELTGVLTRRALRELGPAMLDRERRSGRGMALLMLDLDHFKAINDRFGHASGDLVLQRIGAILRTQLRPEALLARYGGEEFVALVPVDDLRVARQVAERLREAALSTTWLAVDGRPMVVTLSVGVAVLGEQEALDDALQRADEALYRAKNDGRNQVQVAIASA